MKTTLTSFTGSRIRIPMLTMRSATGYARCREVLFPLCVLTLFSFVVLSSVGSERMAAQPPNGETGDSTKKDDSWGEDWTLDSLNVEDFDFDTEQIFHSSRGWFPTPFKATSLSFVGIFPYADVFDRATDLRTRAFTPTTAPFNWRDPYNTSWFGEFLGVENKEKKILKPNSDESVEDGYPQSGYGQFGLRFLYHLPIPAIIRADAYYSFLSGILYSEDTTRNYLSLDGVPRQFREIGVVYHEREMIAGSIGLQIPFYGIFMSSDFGSLGSYYYLFGALAGDYAVVAKTTQYVQIADAKDQIRYGNGQDTLDLMLRAKPEGVNRARTAVEAGIGWGLSAEFIVLGFEAFISAPLTSVVDDGDWKEYYAGFRINMGYQWGTRRQSK